MWKSIMVALNRVEGFFENFPCFIKNSRVNLKLIDLTTIKNWKFHWKSLNDFFRYFDRRVKKLYFEENEGKVENALKLAKNQTPIYLNTKQENRIY